MSDIEKKIDEALASLRAAHPRARERTLRIARERPLRGLSPAWAEAALALARATGHVVTTSADGGAVPNSYKYRAQTDFLRVVARPDGTADVTATRTHARSVSGGGGAGWGAIWISGGADLADAIKPHLPKGSTRRENGNLKINGATADLWRVVHALTADYAAAAAAVAADAARSAALDAALGEDLAW